MYVTFATCWYSLTSKFPVDTYLRWMKHMLTEVTNYNLVLFTDAAGELLLRDHFAPYYFQNPRIKIVQKPIETWHNYQYQKAWIKNHTKNTSLNGKTEWKLNMLWAEKINFVNEARVNEYFPPTEFYGWCDIGYFREGPCPTFCTTPKILALNKNKIYYACVDEKQFAELREIVERKNEQGLPMIPIPPQQNSIAGGFFIAHHSKIEGWRQLFDHKLRLYFQENYLVKDDQMILVDCILSEPQRFEIIRGAAPSTPGAAPSTPGAAPSTPGAAPSTPGAAPSTENPWFEFRRHLG
jgi:hypothetical protein